MTPTCFDTSMGRDSSTTWVQRGRPHVRLGAARRVMVLTFLCSCASPLPLLCNPRARTLCPPFMQLTVKELKALKYLAKPLLPPKLNSVDNAYEQVQVAMHHTTIHPDYVRTERMPTLEEVIQLLEVEAPHM